MKEKLSFFERLNRWIKGIYERRLWRKHMYSLGYVDGSSGFLKIDTNDHDGNQYYHEGYFAGVRDYNKSHRDLIHIKNKRTEEVVIENF